MESPHPDERPPKKRRFFTEDSSPVQVRDRPRNGPPRSSPPPPSADTVKTSDESTNTGILSGGDAFDVGILQAVVGELPAETLQKLKDVSSGDVQRGMYERHGNTLFN